MGKMDVSLTEVLQRADITAASKRLLDVRKFASAMSWITMRERIFFFLRVKVILASGSMKSSYLV